MGRLRVLLLLLCSKDQRGGLAGWLPVRQRGGGGRGAQAAGHSCPSPGLAARTRQPGAPAVFDARCRLDVDCIGK